MTRIAARTSAAAAELASAVEAFARGFAFTRSFAHPYVAERVGRLWVVRDAPRKRPQDYRREEWISHRTAPPEVDRVARAGTRGRFAVCAIRLMSEPDEPIRAAYKSLGYRLGTTEPVMVHRLRRVPKLPEPFPVRRVTGDDLADRLARAARTRQILPEHFAPGAPLRQYAALDGGQPIGWVRSIVVGDSAWVSNMYVDPEYRRRGVGRSLLSRMLRDDRTHGATRSVLLASHAGALLYPVVGYEQIGELLLFTPRKT